MGGLSNGKEQMQSQPPPLPQLLLYIVVGNVQVGFLCGKLADAYNVNHNEMWVYSGHI